MNIECVTDAVHDPAIDLKPVRRALLSVTDKTLMILVCGIFLYFPSLFGSMTIDRFLFFQTSSLAIAMTVSLFFLLNKKISFSFVKNWWPDKIILLQILPFGIIVLMMSVHSRLDAFLLERISSNGAYEAGIYAAAYRLLDAANIACFIIASFMLPYIARRWSKNEEINSSLLNCRHLLLLFAIGVSSVTVFLAPWIQEALYHHDDAAAVQVLQWCLPSLMGYAITHIYGTALTATGRVVEFCYIVLISVIINVALNLLLIPSMGAKGCCFAALASQSFCAIATMLYVKRKLVLSLDTRSLLIYIFTAALLSGFFFVGRDWPVAKWLLILTAAMLTITIMLATKLTGITTWIGSLKSRTIN